jgi:hypothetical protein
LLNAFSRDRGDVDLLNRLSQNWSARDLTNIEIQSGAEELQQELGNRGIEKSEQTKETKLTIRKTHGALALEYRPCWRIPHCEVAGRNVIPSYALAEIKVGISENS